MKKKVLKTTFIVALFLAMFSVTASAACDHQWSEWKTTTSATYSNKGLKTRYCKKCNAKQEKTISKKSTSTKQKNVKKVVDNFFTAAQKYNTSKMKSCFMSSAKPSFFVQKKYMAKFVKKMNKKLTYDITKINVSGSKATVKVKCKYRSAYNAYITAMEDVVVYYIRHPYASDSAVDKYQYNRTLKYYNKYSKKYSSKTLTINLKKSNGKWKISKWTKALNNAVHANYQKAYDDFF